MELECSVPLWLSWLGVGVCNVLLDLIYSKIPWGEERDRLRWQLTKNGVFMFALITWYSKVLLFLPSPERVSSVLSLPWGFLLLFLWTAAWGRILTHDNLMRRGFSLVSCCCMCQCRGETVAHLLLHCDFALGCGVAHLVFLGCNGFYSEWPLIFYSVGRIG